MLSAKPRLFPETDDLDIHGTFCDKVISPSNCIDDLVTGEYPARSSHQVIHDSKFSEGQICRFVVHSDLAATRMNYQIVDFYHFRSVLKLFYLPSEHRFYPGTRILGLNGFVTWP